MPFACGGSLDVRVQTHRTKYHPDQRVHQASKGALTVKLIRSCPSPAEQQYSTIWQAMIPRMMPGAMACWPSEAMRPLRWGGATSYR